MTVVFNEVSIRQVMYINLRKNLVKKWMIKWMLSRCSYATRRVEGVLFDSENSTHVEYVENGFEEYLLSVSEERKAGVAGCWIAHVSALESMIPTIKTRHSI